ncbi:MAG: hypothetical protein ACF8Q5_01295 [Phycisphaerales bacterium JB040]
MNARMRRRARTMTVAGLLALSGAALPAVAQNTDRGGAQERERGEEALERRRAALERAVENGTMTRERADEMMARAERAFREGRGGGGGGGDGMREGGQPERDRGALMEQRRQRIEQAVENGRLSRERADEMLARLEQMGDEEGARGRMTEREPLPAQIGKLVELRDAQQGEVNELVRELRQNQLRVLRELRGELGIELDLEDRDGAGVGDRAPGARGRGEGGEAGSATGDTRRERGDRGDAPETDRPRRDRDGMRDGTGRDEERADRPAPPEQRGRRGSPEGQQAEAEAGEDTGGPLGGPEVNDRSERGQRGAGMGGPGADEGPMGRLDGAFARLSDEEKARVFGVIREKLVPVQREFAAGLREILDDDQETALRERWDELEVLPPALARLRDDVRAAREARAEGDRAGRRGEAGQGGRRGAGEDGERAPRERPQRGGRGGRAGGDAGGDDDPGS